MKTLKLTIFATLLAFIMVSVANADGFKSKPATKVINMTFQQAMQNPVLVAAMYQQLNDYFLGDIQATYTVQVAFQGYFIRITGTHDQWVIFFMWQQTKIVHYNTWN
jgi:hypothetical protein